MQEKIHGYEIEATLQERGNSRVLLLRDHDAFIVMKTLPFKVDAKNHDASKHFTEEADCLRKLNHPCIIPLIKEYRNPVAISIPYIEGTPLSNLIDGGLSKESIVSITTALIDAIGHIHKAGLLHCDLKPENILIQENAQPVIIDFGLARRNDADFSSVIGSSTYMPPEVKEGEAWSEQGELFALGIIFNEMLQNCLEDNTLINEQRVMQKCLQRAQSKRYQNSKQLMQAWENRQPSEKVLRPKSRVRKKHSNNNPLNRIVFVLAVIAFLLCWRLIF